MEAGSNFNLTPGYRPAKSTLYPWYDSIWLSDYTRARAVIRKVKPQALKEFETAMRVFRTPRDFEVRKLERVFDDETMAKIRDVVSAIRPDELELHESKRFGRFILHDHIYFTTLQKELTGIVSDSVGELVEPSYNFLSLYVHLGVCPPHLDAPTAKYTLDLCINQSVPWPIHCSEVQEWPEWDSVQWPQNWEEQIKHSSSLRFNAYTLEPGKAIIFSGSSQWHYREPIPATNSRQFCDLLFFHFIPAGTAALARPQNWARIFSIPELGEGFTGNVGTVIDDK
jgi:hypothetical protein